MKMEDIKITPEYQVSRQTALLVEAYDTLNKIYNNAYVSLCELWDEETATTMLAADLIPGINGLQDGIFKLMQATIIANRTDNGSTKI